MKVKLNFAVLLMAVVGLCSLPALAATAAGAVYTLSNSSSGNAVMVFARMADGRIASTGTFSTGGAGTGAGLGSQGALATDIDNRFLFAVNASSNNISVFKILENGLQLVDLVASGGQQPISLAVSHQLLYVLNDGGAVGGNDTIAGFAVAADGHLTLIASGLPLSGTAVGPAEIAFNNNGDTLLVSEKSTSIIDLFTVGADGVAVGPTVIPSAGETPYGFAFGKRDQVIVSDAFGGATGAGAVSSYAVRANQMLQTLSGQVADKQSAPCWVALSSDGRFAYTTNTASGNVSGYNVGFAGAMSLLNSDGVTASTGSGSTPIDAAVSNDSRYLYVLTPGTSNLQGFAIAMDGSLAPVNQASGIPASAGGLVAR